MNTTRMTPKDFAYPLLAVLATLTEYEANVSVPMTETYSLVCEHMGIREDYGGETEGGYKFTHRNIGLAFRQHIRGKGLGEQAKKGHWMLTQVGVDKARETAGDEAPPVPETVATPVDEAPEELAAARADATAEVLEDDHGEDGAEVLHLPVANTNPKHPYSDDPYIRTLAIEAVECYGAWSSRSDACETCPLATDCRLQVGARKAEMAAEMEATEEASLARAKAQEEEANKKGISVEELIEKMGEEGTTPRDPQKGKFKPTDGQDFARANASRESMCLQCGETIKKGDPVQWCADEGIFHVECFDDSDQ